MFGIASYSVVFGRMFGISFIMPSPYNIFPILLTNFLVFFLIAINGLSYEEKIFFATS